MRASHTNQLPLLPVTRNFLGATVKHTPLKHCILFILSASMEQQQQAGFIPPFILGPIQRRLQEQPDGAGGQRAVARQRRWFKVD
jgi:hypothetical protein